MSSSLSGNTIISNIWGLIWNFIVGIMYSILGAIQEIIFSITGSFQGILFSWARSVEQYGIWGPLMASVSLGATFFITYIILDIVGGERDVLDATEAI